MTKKKPLPKHLLPQEEAITELAANGLTKSAIIRKLGLAPNVFNAYEEPQSWYLTGRALLSERVTADILKAAPASFLDRRLLADRLNLFQEPFEMKRITSPAGARTLIATGIQKYCLGEMSEIALNTITKAALAFIESHSQTILQKDLAEIKKQLKARK